MMTKPQLIRWVLKPAVFLLCLLPLMLLVRDGLTGNLSANPISDITHETGTWTLRFLLITLSITPIRKMTGWNSLLRFRRMLGLFAFLYVTLHFFTYIYLDQFFDFGEIVKDVAKRPFITVGFASFLILIPLAVTSNDKLTKWLGGKRWQALHRLIYVAAMGGVIHYLWLVKADTQRPLTYGALLLLLLGYRLWVTFAPKLQSIREVVRKDTGPASSP